MVLEGDASAFYFDDTATAHVVQNLRDRLARGGNHRGEILMREAKIYGHRAAILVPLPKFLGEEGQEIRQTHLRLSGQQALDQLLVLDERELQERHRRQSRPRFPPDGALHEDLGYFCNLTLRDGFCVGALPRLTNEREGSDDVPGPPPPAR